MGAAMASNAGSSAVVDVEMQSADDELQSRNGNSTTVVPPSAQPLPACSPEASLSVGVVEQPPHTSQSTSVHASPASEHTRVQLEAKKKLIEQAAAAAALAKKLMADAHREYPEVGEIQEELSSTTPSSSHVAPKVTDMELDTMGGRRASNRPSKN